MFNFCQAGGSCLRMTVWTWKWTKTFSTKFSNASSRILLFVKQNVLDEMINLSQGHAMMLKDKKTDNELPFSQGHAILWSSCSREDHCEATMKCSTLQQSLLMYSYRYKNFYLFKCILVDINNIYFKWIGLMCLIMLFTLTFLCWKYMTTFAFVDSAPISCAGKHVRGELFICQSPTFSTMLSAYRRTYV